jgi:hypothetical protein
MDINQTSNNNKKIEAALVKYQQLENIKKSKANKEAVL